MSTEIVTDGNSAMDEYGSSFPIVGIGASAGGLSAFEAFFSKLADDTPSKMAFVLIQHLAPDHKSMLTELVGRFTHIPVFEIEDGVQIRPNCVYISPPNHEVACVNGTLQLLEPMAPRGQRLPIDFFFNSLAEDQHQRSIGIVLSGTGSDGAQGIRAIKASGGLVLAQDPETTDYKGMPQSAIATGCVDFVLPPAEMPSKLATYHESAFHSLPVSELNRPTISDEALQKICFLLRKQTGHDFSQYKPNTIVRRIDRRMAVNQIETVDGYLQFAQQSPSELDSLFRDLLIGVTQFFRDPESFEVLKTQVIPLVFEEAASHDSIRVWVSGCSTGEEAYSLAILLHEFMESKHINAKVQIFATDIDSKAIGIARAGVYPASIAANLTPERLTRYFIYEPETNTYRVSKSIREMIVISEQDVIKDPPFSKLDLISCRNLMIYLGASLQRKLIPLFHFALRPNGFLFLGTSEGIGDSVDLFSVVDRKTKVYRRKPDSVSTQAVHSSRFALTSNTIPLTSQSQPKPVVPYRLSLRELAEQSLLKLLDPVAALVNAQGDLLFLYGKSGNFLEPSEGESGVNNVLRMAREGLRPALTLSLYKAASSKLKVHVEGIHVVSNNHIATVELTVAPVVATHVDAPLFLVLFREQISDGKPIDSLASNSLTDESTEISNEGVISLHSDSPLHIKVLMDELRSRDEYLQNAREELESANEELRSSNEEMQSVNEELQSTNEELETSKEELQSINEELATVNTELHAKVTELSRLNNDLNNLLSGTGVATVFVDLKLCILRFTPTIAQLINLIPSDVGRPVGHIVSNFMGYNSLVPDAQSVLDTLVSVEKQVQTSNGLWFTLRIRPYRTLENVIEGLVITFVDITEMKRTEEALEKANQQLRLIANSRDASPSSPEDLP